MFPYAKIGLLVGFFGRFIMLCISYRKPSIVKFYIYYELVLHNIGHCLPYYYIKFADVNYVSSLMLTIMFISLYFDFWGNLSATIFSQIILAVIRIYLFKEMDYLVHLVNFAVISIVLAN